MEASSIVEVSFSAFQRFVGSVPRSFAGGVQQHVKKDQEKLNEELALFVKSQLLPFDENTCNERTDAANKCATIYLHVVTDRFSETNIEAQNYEKTKVLNISLDQHASGVTSAYSVF